MTNKRALPRDYYCRGMRLLDWLRLTHNERKVDSPSQKRCPRCPPCDEQTGIEDESHAGGFSASQWLLMISSRGARRCVVLWIPQLLRAIFDANWPSSDIHFCIQQKRSPNRRFLSGVEHYCSVACLALDGLPNRLKLGGVASVDTSEIKNELRRMFSGRGMAFFSTGDDAMTACEFYSCPKGEKQYPPTGSNRKFHACPYSARPERADSAACPYNNSSTV